jgi:monoamine oxidase
MSSQPSTLETYDVVIVGGGIAGLTVAYELENKSVLLLEKEQLCGGRTLSMNMGPYVFNQGAQMIPGGETNVAKLADKLGVTRTLINKTKTSTYMKGKFVAGSSEFKFLLGLPIPFIQKLKMAFGIMRIRSRYSGMVDLSPRSDDRVLQELSGMSLVERLNIRHPDVKAFWDAISKTSSTLRADEQRSRWRSRPKKFPEFCSRLELE